MKSGQCEGFSTETWHVYDVDEVSGTLTPVAGGRGNGDGSSLIVIGEMKHPPQVGKFASLYSSNFGVSYIMEHLIPL